MKNKDTFDSDDEDFSRKTAFMGRDKVKKETLYSFLKRRTKSVVQKNLKNKRETAESFTYTHNKILNNSAQFQNTSFDQSFEFRDTNKSFTNNELVNFRTLSPERSTTPYKRLINSSTIGVDTETQKPDFTHKKKKGILDDSFEKASASGKGSTRRPNLMHNNLRDADKGHSRLLFDGFSPRKLSRTLRLNENSLNNLINEFDNIIKENAQKTQDLLKLVERVVATCQRVAQMRDPDLANIFDDIKTRRALLKKSIENQSYRSEKGWELIKQTFETFENELNFAIEDCSRRTKKLLESHQRVDITKEFSRIKADVTQDKFYSSAVESDFNISKCSFKFEDGIYRNRHEETMLKRRNNSLEQQIEVLREEASRKDDIIMRLENEIEALKIEPTYTPREKISDDHVRSHALFMRLEDKIAELQDEIRQLRASEDELRNRVIENKSVESVERENALLRAEIANKEREKEELIEKIQQLEESKIIKQQTIVEEYERENRRLKDEFGQKERNRSQTIDHLEELLDDREKKLKLMSTEMEKLKREQKSEILRYKTELQELKRENSRLFNKFADQTLQKGEKEAANRKYDEIMRKYDSKKAEVNILWSLLRELKICFNSEKFTSCIKSLLIKYGFNKNPQAKFFHNIV